jgi:uncharacterized protein
MASGPVTVFELREGELWAGIERKAKDAGITRAAIVSVIGWVEGFTVSTSTADGSAQDVETAYDQPADLMGNGDIIAGRPHVHVTMAVEGDRAVAGHLISATIGNGYAYVYLIAIDAPQ